MTSLTPSRPRLLATAAVLCLALGACGGEDTPDPLAAGDQSLEEQGIDVGEPDPNAASCLAGDADCVDESYSGQDVTRPVPLSSEPSDAPAIERGPTTGATGRMISAAHLRDDATLQLAFEGGACDTVEDVLVTEAEGEVRLLVLSGPAAGTDSCAAVLQSWSVEVALDAPLGDRTVLDLAG